MDVAGTVSAVLRSASARRFFWVFLDHQMTAGPLESVLDSLAAEYNHTVVPMNLDQALLYCEQVRDARCFERPSDADRTTRQLVAAGAKA